MSSNSNENEQSSNEASSSPLDEKETGKETAMEKDVDMESMLPQIRSVKQKRRITSKKGSFSAEEAIRMLYSKIKRRTPVMDEIKQSEDDLEKIMKKYESKAKTSQNNVSRPYYPKIQILLDNQSRMCLKVHGNLTSYSFEQSDIKIGLFMTSTEAAKLSSYFATCRGLKGILGRVMYGDASGTLYNRKAAGTRRHNLSSIAIEPVHAGQNKVLLRFAQY